MSTERIVEHSRRRYSCERCGQPIKLGTRYRRKTVFPSDVDRLYGNAPVHIATHLDCPPW